MGPALSFQTSSLFSFSMHMVSGCKGPMQQINEKNPGYQCAAILTLKEVQPKLRMLLSTLQISMVPFINSGAAYQVGTNEMNPLVVIM